MVIAVVYRPPAMTAEQYKTSWDGDQGPLVPLPPSLLFHAGGGGKRFLHGQRLGKSRSL
jgi:hypothetical protein